MKSSNKQLLLALSLSLTIYAVNAYWYFFSQRQNHSQHREQPLAFVVQSIDDTQKRPSSRLIWQPLQSGEALYNGEAIRTASQGQVRIQFANSERYLEVEPDSLIILQKTQNTISLDLLEGNLFVSQAKNENNQFVVQSAQGTLDLSKASASLSKKKGRTINLDVIDGQVSVKNKKSGEQKNLQKGSQIQLTESGQIKNSEEVSRTPAAIAPTEDVEKKLEALVPAEPPPPPPLIPGPQFLGEGVILKANRDGELILKWNPVDRAKEYWIVVFRKGQELKRSRYFKTQTVFKNLLPGEYELQLHALDSMGRPSATTDRRTIFVPEKSSVKAPTIQKVRIQ